MHGIERLINRLRGQVGTSLQIGDMRPRQELDKAIRRA